jgi:hypothetical protein
VEPLTRQPGRVYWGGRVMSHRLLRGGLRRAARYQRGTYVEIPRSDHLVFFGEALPVTMGHIDDWTARNHVLAIA